MRVVALLLRLDHPDRLPIDVEQVVGVAVAGLQRELADSDTPPGVEVHRVAVLDRPACGLQRGVDLSSCGLLWGFLTGHSREQSTVKCPVAVAAKRGVMELIGVDGCRGGWVVAVRSDQERPRAILRGEITGFCVPPGAGRPRGRCD